MTFEEGLPTLSRFGTTEFLGGLLLFLPEDHTSDIAVLCEFLRELQQQHTELEDRFGNEPAVVRESVLRILRGASRQPKRSSRRQRVTLPESPITVLSAAEIAKERVRNGLTCRGVLPANEMIFRMLVIKFLLFVENYRAA